MESPITTSARPPKPGCRSVAELTMRTGAGATCGSCLDMAAELLEAARAVRELPLPVLSQAA